MDLTVSGDFWGADDGLSLDTLRSSTNALERSFAAARPAAPLAALNALKARDEPRLDATQHAALQRAMQTHASADSAQLARGARGRRLLGASGGSWRARQPPACHAPPLTRICALKCVCVAAFASFARCLTTRLTASSPR